jgi:tRNA-splicing ligase RtcB
MSISQITGATVDVHIWTPLESVESAALTQLRNIASLPWVRHVKAMPDVHLGKGATVGSVIAMKDAVAPSAVGVDIGCGMAAVMSNLTASDLPENLRELRAVMEEVVPVGNFKEGSRQNITKHPLAKALMEGDKLRGITGFKDLHGAVQERDSIAYHQIGTLGGGNHFIELCLDDGTCPTCKGTGTAIKHNGAGPDLFACSDCSEGKIDPRVWLMLHSGSRNIGKSIAEAHIKLAKVLEHNSHLPDKDLAVFLNGTPEMVAYRRDLYWAQDFARVNRAVMLAELQEAISGYFSRSHKKVKWSKDPETNVQCHHNYVAEETHYGEHLFVTRKGAIKAGKGDMGIIPGSMGTRSYIVRGLGNPESLESASHGAGRRMSRGEAKRTFSIEDLRTQTAGVECRKDIDVLDEIPSAYKNIDEVMANQKDLVEIATTLKQVLCIKG